MIDVVLLYLYAYSGIITIILAATACSIFLLILIGHLLYYAYSRANEHIFKRR